MKSGFIFYILISLGSLVHAETIHLWSVEEGSVQRSTVANNNDGVRRIKQMCLLISGKPSSSFATTKCNFENSSGYCMVTSKTECTVPYQTRVKKVVSECLFHIAEVEESAQDTDLYRKEIVECEESNERVALEQISSECKKERLLPVIVKRTSLKQVSTEVSLEDKLSFDVSRDFTFGCR